MSPATAGRSPVPGSRPAGAPVPFGERLAAAMAVRGPLCVGLDPHPWLLRDWGLGDDCDGLDRFSRIVVDALAAQVAVLKPQSAFYERHGSAGVAVLERTVAAVRAAGALVLLDVKRGDIGSTMQAYADAYADPASALCADAVTASPYLGFGSLQPLLDTADRHGGGVFVLALTSNPEGAQVQQARGADGRTVAGAVLAAIAAANASALAGGAVLGSVGAVVGATVVAPEESLDIGGPLLAPGIGAQGAGPADLRRVFGAALAGVLPTSSREVLAAGPGAGALGAAARRVTDACAAALGR